jgi:hypothetical protein
MIKLTYKNLNHIKIKKVCLILIKKKINKTIYKMI